MPEIKIGTWIEKEPRKVQRGTSLACDYINHLTFPGEYDVFLVYENIWRDNDETGAHELVGVNAKELHYVVNTKITDGMLYSGFGGNHHPSTPIEPKLSQIVCRPYDYYARALVNDGNLVLDPEFMFLADPWNLEFGAYLEQVSVGLHRHFGLDPYWHYKTAYFAERMYKTVEAIHNDGDYDGYDIGQLNKAEKMGYLYWGCTKEEKVHWTVKGKDFITKKLGIDMGQNW